MKCLLKCLIIGLFAFYLHQITLLLNLFYLLLNRSIKVLYCLIRLIRVVYLVFQILLYLILSLIDLDVKLSDLNRKSNLKLLFYLLYYYK